MSADETISQTLLQIQRAASVQQVYGEPITVGGETVIPVAEVRYSFGFGFGAGPNRAASKPKKRPAEGPNGQGTTPGNADPAGDSAGGGAGGKASARPVGYLMVREGEVRFEPVVDVSRLAMMAIVTVGWLFYLVSRARRR